MMIIFKRLLFLMQFFTIIPFPFRLRLDEDDFGKALAYSPLSGLMIGLILFIFYEGFIRLFSPLLTSVFTVIIYVILTGGLHIDGLGDTFDGIFCRGSKEKILEIMRDSRIGTYGAVSIICIIFLYIALFTEFGRHAGTAVLVMPAAGKIGLLLGAGISKSARQDGLGKGFIDYCGLKEVFIGFCIIIIIIGVIAGLKELAGVIFALFAAFGFIQYANHKIQGVTGDILGAVCELTQCIFLISVLVIQRLNLL